MTNGGLTSIVVAQGSTSRLAVRQGFVREAPLQSLIESTPQLLDALGDGLRFIPIGQEIPAGTGRVDVVFVDSEGLVTLVETKLKANHESRREVIGQILEYAVAASEWDLEQIDQMANAYYGAATSTNGMSSPGLDVAIAGRLGLSVDEEGEARIAEFRAKIGQSLSEGRLRVVVAIDEQVGSLEALVGYLSAHSDLEVVLLQVSRFVVQEDVSVLIPSFLGNIPATKRPPPSPRRVLTKSTLLDSYSDQREREAVGALLDAAALAGASFEFGPSGVSVRGRSPLWPQPVTIAWLYSQGVPRGLTWMRTKDLSFGWGLTEVGVPVALRDVLDAYARSFASDGVGEDASSKGVAAWSMTAAQAADRLPELCARLRSVLAELASLAPTDTPASPTA